MVGFQLNPLPWPNPFHSISTALQQVNAELLVSWDDEIPNIYIYTIYIYIWKNKKSSKPPTHMNIDSYWIAPLSMKHGFTIFIRKLSTIS